MNRRAFLGTTFATIAVPAFAGGHGRVGTFSGLNNHITTGTAEIAADGVQLLADFTFDGAPDPKVALGRDGTYDPATIMGPLANDAGASIYSLPDGINPEDYNEVYIWCEKFNVGLGVAQVG